VSCIGNNFEFEGMEFQQSEIKTDMLLAHASGSVFGILNL
jgi:hypothetical protein